MKEPRERLMHDTLKSLNLIKRLRLIRIDTGQTIRDWVGDALDKALKEKGR